MAKKRTPKKPKCSVDNCKREALVEVILYDVYPAHESVFYEQDFTCPYLCGQHMIENEEKAKGERKPRGTVHYPYSNRHMAQGFTIYNPLDKGSDEVQ